MQNKGEDPCIKTSYTFSKPIDFHSKRFAMCSSASTVFACVTNACLSLVAKMLQRFFLAGITNIPLILIQWIDEEVLKYVGNLWKQLCPAAQAHPWGTWGNAIGYHILRLAMVRHVIRNEVGCAHETEWHCPSCCRLETRATTSTVSLSGIMKKKFILSQIGTTDQTPWGLTYHGIQSWQRRAQGVRLLGQVLSNKGASWFCQRQQVKARTINYFKWEANFHGQVSKQPPCPCP